MGNGVFHRIVFNDALFEICNMPDISSVGNRFSLENVGLENGGNFASEGHHPSLVGNTKE